jgi:hypothetical protein
VIYALVYIISMNYLNLNIRQLLESGRISTGRLANIVDMHQPTLFRILAHPEREPRLRTIEPLARLLGVPVTDLITKDLREMIAASGPNLWRSAPRTTQATEPDTPQSIDVGMGAPGARPEFNSEDKPVGQPPVQKSREPTRQPQEPKSRIGASEVIPAQLLKLADYEREGGVIQIGEILRRVGEIDWSRDQDFGDIPHQFNTLLTVSQQKRVEAKNQSELERDAFFDAVKRSKKPQDLPKIRIHSVSKRLDWLSDRVAAIFMSTLAAPPLTYPIISGTQRWNPISESRPLERSILRMALIKTTSQRRRCVILALIGREISPDLGEQRLWEAAQLGVQVIYVRSGTEAARALFEIEQDVAVAESDIDMHDFDTDIDPSDES